MPYELSPSVQQIVDLKMSSGLYDSQDQLLIAALQALDDYEQTVADVREGLEDEIAGRTISIADAEREIRQEFGFTS